MPGPGKASRTADRPLRLAGFRLFFRLFLRPDPILGNPARPIISSYGGGTRNTTKNRYAGRRKAAPNSSVCLIPALFGVLGSVSLGEPIVAQTVRPGGTVSDQFEEPELPQSQPVAPYRIETPTESADAAPQPPFMVLRIIVDGAGRFSDVDFDALTAGFEGRDVTLGELNGLAARIARIRR